MEVINYFKARGITGGGPPFQDARKSLYAKGIKTSYEPSPNESYDTNTLEECNGSAVGKRIVFYLTSDAQPDAMTQGCDGLILERDTWRPLVIPPFTTRGSQPQIAVDGFLSQGFYDVIPSRDGTMVHFYFFQGVWHISTTRSYDIGDVCFTNTDMKYRQIIDETLEGCGLGSFDQFTLLLDKNCSYSCIITHPEVHLYWKTRAVRFMIVLVQRANLTTAERHYDWGMPTQLPVQTPIDFAAYGFTTINLGILKQLCDNDPNIKPNVKGALPLAQLMDIVQFGIILRSRDRAKTGRLSFLSVESVKYNNIKHTLYENSIYANMTPDFNRENFIVLHAYLNRYYHSVFLDLFPQYNHVYEGITKRIHSLVVHLDKMYINQKTIADKPQRIATKHPELILAVKSKIDEIVTINVDDANSTKLLKSYILSSAMTPVIYPYVFV